MKMTKRLEEAIELIRNLSDEERDKAVDFVFVYLSNEERDGSPDDNESALIAG